MPSAVCMLLGGSHDDDARALCTVALRLPSYRWRPDGVVPERGDHGPYTQMRRLAIYRDHAQRLIDTGKAYRCYCTKADLAAQKLASAGGHFKYPNTCRDRIDEPDLPYVVRFKTHAAGKVVYVDKVFGEIPTPNSELQDFVLLRSDGVPRYNFGAVVDDLTMGITLIARGRDHMINTPPQILLFQAFGASVPEFAHHESKMAHSPEMAVASSALSKVTPSVIKPVRHVALSIAAQAFSSHLRGRLLQ